MILESVILNVKAGFESEFELDFNKASEYISVIKGYSGHSLHKCLETKNQYLLLVNWEKLENHTIGFRNSPEYQEWKKLLHNYYNPFPVVEHYEMVMENKRKQ